MAIKDDRDEKCWVARLVHLFYSDDDVQFLVRCILLMLKLYIQSLGS